MSLAMSNIEVPTPERKRLSLSSFSIIRIKFREARLRTKARINSFSIDLCIIFIGNVELQYFSITDLLSPIPENVIRPCCNELLQQSSLREVQ